MTVMIDASDDYDETWISYRRPDFRSLIIVETLSISLGYHSTWPSKVDFISCISFLTWIFSVRLLYSDEGSSIMAWFPSRSYFLWFGRALHIHVWSTRRACEGGHIEALIGSDAYLSGVELKHETCPIVLHE